MLIFADSMCIRMIEGRVRPARGGADRATIDRAKNFLLKAQTFADLMPISRNREEPHQSPTTGKKADGLATKRRNFCQGQLFSPTCVRTGTNWENQRWLGDQRSKTGKRVKICEILDLVAVNFRELMPISDYRARNAVA